MPEHLVACDGIGSAVGSRVHGKCTVIALQVVWSACRIEDDGQSLVEYSIKTKSKLHLVRGLRGGMQDSVKKLSSKTIKLEVASSDIM